jgi:uncharacterized surface protein with fasciclin (FAS1) repeats
MSNIIETAVAANSFNTLVTAIKVAGLLETLAERGPFTLFAPNDKAFAQLPAEEFEALLKDGAKLKQLLIYHLVEDRLPFSEMIKLASVQSLQGQRLGIARHNGVKVNHANVIQTDLLCDNGIIHMLDAVLILPPTKYPAGVQSASPNPHGSPILDKEREN